MSEQQPSVGRAVHYVSHGSPVREDGTQAYTSECRAATVTEVGRGNRVGLCVMNPTGLFFQREINHDAGVRRDDNLCDGREHEGGTWHWPARV